jgi:sodium/bile acid cotransporter 7
MLKKFFLPISLIVAAIAALISDKPGTCLNELGFVQIFVIIIFLVNGYQMKLQDFKVERSFWKTIAFAAIISLLAGPFLGMFIGQAIGLSGVLALGLLVMSSVPPTLSSGIVITGAAHGNRLWALFLTIGLNIIGIFTIPIMLKLSLHNSEDVYISPLPLFFKLLLYVLLPLLVGVIVRKYTSKHDISGSLKYLPSICVILMVWVALSASSKLLLDVQGIQYLYMALGGLTVHGILLLANWMGGKFLLRLKGPENKALLFVASQKTLPISISVLAALGGETALALLTCMIFHFGQLLVDSIISAKMASK